MGARAQQCCAPTEGAGKSRFLTSFGMTASGGRRRLAGGCYWFFLFGLFLFLSFLFFLNSWPCEFLVADLSKRRTLWRTAGRLGRMRARSVQGRLISTDALT